MANREDVDLSAYLAPKGKAPGIGAETGTVVRDGISVLKSPHGSVRYLFSRRGEPLGVLQVVNVAKGVAVVANVYVVKPERRRGIATKLYERASKDFDVRLPDRRMISEDGLGWSEALPGFKKNGEFCQAEWLKDYLDQDIDFYDYSHLVEVWSDGEVDGYYDDLTDEQKADFEKFVVDNISKEPLDESAPPYRFFEKAEMMEPESWLIHFTNKSFGSFKYGAVLETLALSTFHTPKPADCESNTTDDIGIDEVVWGFAMDAMSSSSRELREARRGYGKRIILFQTDCAVKAYHLTDMQWQCIFPICSEYNVHTGTMQEDGLIVLDDDEDGVEYDSVADAVSSIESKGNMKPNKRIQLDFSEANNAAQKVAKALVDAIDPEYFKQDEESKLEGLHGLGIPLIEVMEKATVPIWIKVHDIDVYVLLECVEPNRPSPRTYLSAQAGWNKYGTKKHPVVTIFLNGHQRLSHFKSWAAVLQIEHALRHELTHVIDPKLMKGVKIGYGIVGRDKATDAVEYANEIAEVKAFGNELAYWLKDHLQSVGCYDLSEPKCRAELDAALEVQFTEEWPFTHMTEANRRRVRKDVYLYLAGEES